MRFPPEVASIIELVAPTVATALGGPAAGIAAKVIVGTLFKYISPSVTAATVTPDDIVKALEKNINNPELPKDLQAAEKAVLDYEQEYNLRFAHLEAEDRADAREFQKDSGIADGVFRFGKQIFIMGSAVLLVMAAFVVALIFGLVRVSYDATVVTVGFSFLSTVTTAYIGFVTMVLSYYFGSSRGSDAKTVTISDTLQQQGDRLGEAVAAAQQQHSRPAPAVPPPQVVIVPSGGENAAESPADAIAWQQGPHGGARWKVLPGGVLVEGEGGIGRTVGEPVTIRRIWQDHGTLIAAAAQRHGVPAEIICMVIATESRGQPKAFLKEPDGRVSVGLMQILTGTASEVMGRPITFDELQGPELNIEAGTKYILSQYSKTKFDPVFVACSYNSGGIYPPREQDNNRWNLRSTGNHIDRAVLYFNDACAVLKAINA